jgi:hypothetical protein
MPALLIAQFGEPSSEMLSATAARHASLAPTSHEIAHTRIRPRAADSIRSFAQLSRSMLRATIVIDMPLLAKRHAVAKPIPLLPPVIIAWLDKA